MTEQVTASVLCPFFVTTGITRSERNRPAELPAAKPTKSQLIGQAMSDKAVGSGKVTAAMVAQFVFDALREQRFYIYSHPQALASVQTRLEDIVQMRNPTDPFAQKPEIGAGLRAALARDRVAPVPCARRREAERTGLQQPSFSACSGRPLSASTSTRLTWRGCCGSGGRVGLNCSMTHRLALGVPGRDRLVLAHHEVVRQLAPLFSPTSRRWHGHPRSAPRSRRCAVGAPGSGRNSAR